MSRFVVLFAFLLGACSATIMDVLQQRRETTLISLIQAAGLEGTLSGTGTFTLFAPSETAFRSLPRSTLDSLKSDVTALANLLKYHVVAGAFMSSDLMINEKMLESVAGPKIRVNYYMYNSHIALEGARVTTANIKASNGVVHIVDKVMMPPNGTIADILASDPHLSTLKAAVDAAGLTQALQDGPYTLLAPTNMAFNSLGNDTVQALLGNTELLKSILLYHVIHGTLYSTGMHSGSLHNLEEMDRERLVASFQGRLVMVDGSRVLTKDISATNGVIHTLDHVLIPSSVKPAISALVNP